MSDITIASFLFGGSEKIKTPPLGPLYLTANLRKHGYQVDFRDYQLHDTKNFFKIKNIVSFLNNSAEVIGISTMTNFLAFVLLALKEVKRKYPRKTIILGGVGTAGVERLLLRHFPFIDVIVIGEGEAAIVEILNALSSKGSLTGIAGIVFRKNGKIEVNRRSGFLEDLSQLPPPYDKSINLKAYDKISMLSGRGCFFNCTFCEVPAVFGRKIRFRKIDEIVDEILSIYKRIENKDRTPMVCLFDDTLIANRRRLLFFCSALKKKRLKYLKWSCYGRVNMMDEKLMKAMSKSGCRRIYYGVESGSDRILRKIHKGFTSLRARTVIVNSKKYFPEVVASLIFGFPFESFADFQQTILLYFYFLRQEINVQLHRLTPFILTPIYKNYCHRLGFSGEFLSDLTWQSSLKEIPPSALRLIRRYPDIFSGFYHFYSPDLQRKELYLRKICRNIKSL